MLSLIFWLAVIGLAVWILRNLSDLLGVLLGWIAYALMVMIGLGLCLGLILALVCGGH